MEQNVEQLVENAYQTWNDDLFRFALFRVSSREVALDMVSDIYVSLIKQLRKGVEITDIRAFLYQALRNRIIDHYRKRKSDSLDELSEGKDIFANEATQIGETESQLERDQLHRAINQITHETYREILILRFVNQLEIAEIAGIIDETENNVSVRLNRAVKKLATIFPKYET